MVLGYWGRLYCFECIKKSSLWQKILKPSAFTIAEVIIVLGIVGIIAQLTLPRLIVSVQKQSCLSGLKVFYSEFTNGMKNYMQNYGCSDMTCTGFFAGRNDSGETAWGNRAKTELPKIFKNVTLDGYNPEKYHYFDEKYFGGEPDLNYFFWGYTFSLPNGMLIMIADGDAGSCTTYSSAAAGAKLKNACSDIFVDINGTKPPNRWGKDFFQFIIGNDGNLYPFCSQPHNDVYPGIYWTFGDRCGSIGSSKIPAATTGYGCGARIMEESWQINYNF